MPSRSKALIGLLACSVFLSTGRAFCATEELPKDLFNRAVQTFTSGHFAQALPLFQKASQLMPTSPEVHYYLGNSYFCLKKYDEARQEYEKCLALHPSPSLAINTGVALRSVPMSKGNGLKNSTPSIASANIAPLGDEHSNLFQQSVKNMEWQKQLEKRQAQTVREDMKQSWQFNKAREEAKIRRHAEERLAPIEDEWNYGHTLLYGGPLLLSIPGSSQRFDVVGSTVTAARLSSLAGHANVHSVPLLTSAGVGFLSSQVPNNPYFAIGGNFTSLQAFRRGFGGPGGSFDPEIVKARMRVLEQEMQRIKWEEEDALADAKRKVDGHDEEYKAQQETKNKLLDESQSNIQKQIQIPDKGGFGMKPLGTNLYSRYYGDTHPAKALPEAHGATARILPNGHDSSVPDYSIGKDELLKPPAETPSATVSGSVLRKPAETEKKGDR